MLYSGTLNKTTPVTAEIGTVHSFLLINTNNVTAYVKFARTSNAPVFPVPAGGSIECPTNITNVVDLITGISVNKTVTFDPESTDFTEPIGVTLW